MEIAIFTTDGLLMCVECAKSDAENTKCLKVSDIHTNLSEITYDESYPVRCDCCNGAINLRKRNSDQLHEFIIMKFGGSSFCYMVLTSDFKHVATIEKVSRGLVIRKSYNENYKILVLSLIQSIEDGNLPPSGRFAVYGSGYTVRRVD